MKDAHPNKLEPSTGMLVDLSQHQYANQPLLAKIPNFTVDIEKLNWHLQHVVKTFPATYIRSQPGKPEFVYGGWSVTSFNGEVEDGWQSQSGYADGKYSSLRAYQHGYRPRWFHTKKTAICTGYLNEVVDQMVSMGYHPKAIRIWDNPPGGSHIGMHTDGASNTYSVRLHIPIVTNPDCVHIWYTEPEETRHHIPADGSAYLFRTNMNHDTFNFGTTERFHLIAEVWDTQGHVPAFKYRFPMSLPQKTAEAWVTTQKQADAKEKQHG